ncbi:uncharacterized protein LOC123557613 [Mercenaria mercenaria]|uniref:uncharacterized protein LOC123557613 n=1 Tax=Mercenaria mercenaria TaxID=6596 RepID=UPI00234F9022|nr:uncharacterized protein LOC123557613 [Mercenaria mercenaria]
MDVVSAASALRSQLVALHNSDVNVSQLERSVTSLGQQSLMSAIEDNQSQHLRLVLRLSVNEGVCQMYKQFSNKKSTEVQNTARSIKSSMEADDNEQTPPMMISSPPGGRASQDKAAEVWTSVFCELSRLD